MSGSSSPINNTRTNFSSPISSTQTNPLGTGVYSGAQTAGFDNVQANWFATMASNPELQRLFNAGAGTPQTTTAPIGGMPLSTYKPGVSQGSFPSHMTQWSRSGTPPFGSAPYQNSAFNEAWYLQQNPDVAAAVQSGAYPNAQAHYNQFGANEGRLPNQYVQNPFNAQWYLQQNPDVAQAIQAGQFGSAWDHFQQFGQSEGRQPSATGWFNSNTGTGVTSQQPFWSGMTANPNSIPYSTTNPSAVNPYLDFNINQQYAIPAPIGNGIWNQLNLPSSIWSPTSKVDQIDQARTAAVQASGGLYNYAAPIQDTSPTSPFTGATTVHGNTPEWSPTGTDYNSGLTPNPLAATTMNPLGKMRPENMGRRAKFDARRLAAVGTGGRGGGDRGMGRLSSLWQDIYG
jgi:hypothetical protein